MQESTEISQLLVPFSLESFGVSDRGQVRATNEDRFAIAELIRVLHVRQSNLAQSATQPSSNRGHVFVVADGMGGHKAGEVASSISVENIESFQGITKRTEITGVPYETIASLKGVEQLDLYDAKNALMLIRGEGGEHDISLYARPISYVARHSPVSLHPR